MTRKVFTIVLSFLAFNSIGAQNLDIKENSKIYMVSNAHLDTQWKWTVKRTISEYLPNTIYQNFSLIEKYPLYVFNFEGAIKYSWIKEYYPTEYAQIKEYINSGKWHVSGGSWDANDVVFPSPESIFRNFLLGQSYFKEEFGVKSFDIMLPDCFGFPFSLPSIAAHCGIIGFHTQKLRWRYSNLNGLDSKWPFHFGIWEGVDGSQILIAANGGDYTANPTSGLINDELKNDLNNSPINSVFKYYGTVSSAMQADRGGSPLPESVSYLCSLSDSLSKGMLKTENNIKLQLANSDQIFIDNAHLLYSDKLPLYKGELLMDTHGVGCYTSIANMKYLNRENERALFVAESISTLADMLGINEYPRYQLNDATKRFIWHQFHDDLTGTSIPEVYDISINDELLSLSQYNSAIYSSLKSLANNMNTIVKGEALVVSNPIAVSNNSYFKVKIPSGKNFIVLDSNNRKCNTQIITTEEGCFLLVESHLGPLETAVYDLIEVPGNKKVLNKTNENSYTIENRIYRLKLNKNGDISSIYDKVNRKELVRQGDFIGYQMFENNISDQWPAWEISKSTLDSAPVPIEENVSIALEEKGPIRTVLKVSRKYNKSLFTQRYILHHGNLEERIDIVNDVEWNECGKLLKAAFPLNFSASEASFDIGLGNITRGSSTNSSYEVYATNWIDVCSNDKSYGISVLTDYKSGWDMPDAENIRLSLFHSPSAQKNRYESHSIQDHGRHKFTYSIIGHRNEIPKSKLAIAADILNYKKLIIHQDKHNGALGKVCKGLVSSNNGVLIRSIKKAEDGNGFIVRCYELDGRAVENSPLKFNYEILKAEEVNGIEEYIRGAKHDKNNVYVSANAFSPKTYRVIFKDLDINIKKPTYLPVSNLPFNNTSITNNAFVSIGKMDKLCRSYAGELLPDTLFYNGIPFTFGKANFKNAIKCNGQVLELGESTQRIKFLHLLVSSDAESKSTSFKVGGSEYEFFIPQWTNIDHSLNLANSALNCDNNLKIAYIGSHRHKSGARDEYYEPTYMYLISIPMMDSKVIELPKDNSITLFAATIQY